MIIIISGGLTFHDTSPAQELRECDKGFQLHIVRGDATNSAAAQRTKVHFCAVTSTYYCPVGDVSGSGDDDSDYIRQFNTDPFLNNCHEISMESWPAMAMAMDSMDDS